MLIGGFAVILHGVRRTTTDLDVAIRGDAIAVPALLRRLRREQIVPRIEDAETFAMQTLVVLATHVPTGVELDLSLAWSAFEHEALSSCPRARVGRISVPVASPEDLVIYKLIAGRPKDQEDVAALRALHPSMSEERIGRHLAALEALADDGALARPAPPPARPRRLPARPRRQPK